MSATAHALPPGHEAALVCEACGDSTSPASTRRDLFAAEWELAARCPACAGVLSTTLPEERTRRAPPSLPGAPRAFPGAIPDVLHVLWCAPT